MWTARYERMVHRDDCRFLLVFVDFALEFEKKLIAGFDVTIFIDCWMFVPILEKPFAVDYNERHIIVDIDMVYTAIFPG